MINIIIIIIIEVGEKLMDIEPPNFMELRVKNEE